VTIVAPDTDVTPYDLTTSSSRSTFSMGRAIRAAAEDAKRQAIALAAGLLKTEPDQLEVRDGGVYVKNGHAERVGATGFTFGQLIQKAGCGNIMASGTFQTKGGLDPETGQGIASVHWHQAAAGAEVEVDRETGRVKLLAIHAAQYTGRSVNPLNVELQTEGNIIFGIGKAMLEEMLFDNGQMINASLADYMIPAFEDLPERLTVSLHQSPDPDGDPHGVGETALPPIAPAISNAIYNAVGVRVFSLPITPEKVLRALKDGSQKLQTPADQIERAQEAA
jgi:CO/xanthine dehydrogenase Mo-binding subunit